MALAAIQQDDQHFSTVYRDSPWWNNSRFNPVLKDMEQGPRSVVIRIIDGNLYVDGQRISFVQSTKAQNSTSFEEIYNRHHKMSIHPAIINHLIKTGMINSLFLQMLPSKKPFRIVSAAVRFMEREVDSKTPFLPFWKYEPVWSDYHFSCFQEFTENWLVPEYI